MARLTRLTCCRSRISVIDDHSQLREGCAVKRRYEVESAVVLRKRHGKIDLTE